MQGEGGYIVPPQKFFDELREMAGRHGILIVGDEVQCGVGRTGRMWASEHFGCAPDILTVAKGIASGMPLSATIARADLLQWPAGAHASTLGGNPASDATAPATPDTLEAELVDNAARIGGRLLERLREWPRRFDFVGDVRGLGLMTGIEFVRDPESRERAPELRDRVEQLAFERGLLTLGAGRNTLRLSPPLTISRDQAEFAADTLEECLRIVQRER